MVLLSCLQHARFLSRLDLSTPLIVAFHSSHCGFPLLSLWFSTPLIVAFYSSHCGLHLVVQATAAKQARNRTFDELQQKAQGTLYAEALADKEVNAGS